VSIIERKAFGGLAGGAESCAESARKLRLAAWVAWYFLVGTVRLNFQQQ